MFLKDEIALYPLSVTTFLLASKQEKSLRLASRKRHIISQNKTVSPSDCIFTRTHFLYPQSSYTKNSELSFLKNSLTEKKLN